MNVIAKLNSRELVDGVYGGPTCTAVELVDQFEVRSLGKGTALQRHCVTGRMAYYVLSSILTFGVLMLLLIPIGSTFLYIDYKQQLAQRKSNKNDLCKFKCSYDAECIVDEYTSEPFCRCALNCADDYDPVCGSDGSTYVNLCHLRYESCNRQQAITVVTNNACDANLCDTVKCKSYQRCQVKADKAVCVCASVEPCSSQVCGSDGKLYASLCELHKQACLLNRDLVPATLQLCLTTDNSKFDPSDAPNTESTDNTDNSGQTVHQLVGCGNGQKRVCKPDLFSPCNSSTGNPFPCSCDYNCSTQANQSSVCGTDNQNYANECELRHLACLRQSQLQVLHVGKCGHCSHQCDHYSECKVNEFGVPECVCPQVCLRVDRPVCGDNGVTYENECELQVASCRMQRRIGVRFNSSCDLCHNVLCPYGKCVCPLTTDHCSSKAPCEVVANPTDVHSGSVPFDGDTGATCEGGECVCAHNCQNNAAEPLCANDGNTYRNECEMSRIACITRKELIALFYGECEETNEKLSSDSNLSQAVSGAVKSVVDTSLQLTQSECHQSYHFCRETKPENGVMNIYICDNRIFHSKCEMIEFKCRNPSSQHKCSRYCECNRHGTKTNSLQPCNTTTGQCDCKQGVTGVQCDICATKFWNFQNLIDNPFSSGCKACECNRVGSVNNECDPFSGVCRCVNAVKGVKCDQCESPRELTTFGCVLPSSSNLCAHHKCHFGGHCRQNGTHAVCVCPLHCSLLNARHATPVCASDGSLHPSMCHFRQHQCRLQKKLHVEKQCPV